MNDLFPTDFLAAIERLSLSVLFAAPSMASGSHLSPVPGNSLDFRDFTQYSHGDDLRRVDWNIYRRSGHLFLRRFDHPTTTPLYIAIDCSESMFIESPSRYATAARIAAAVAMAAMRVHDDVSIIPFSSRAARPLLRLSGRRRLPEVLNYLSEQQPGGAGTIKTAVSALQQFARRSGVVVVVSDFFEEAGIDTLEESLSIIPHRLVLTQITQPEDSNPQFSTEMELIDSESANTTTITPASEITRRYLEAYNTYQAEIESFALKRGCKLVRIDAAMNMLNQLELLFPSGMMQVAEVRR